MKDGAGFSSPPGFIPSWGWEVGDSFALDVRLKIFNWIVLHFLIYESESSLLHRIKPVFYN